MELQTPQTQMSESFRGKTWISWDPANVVPYDEGRGGRVGKGEVRLAHEARFSGTVQGGNFGFDILCNDMRKVEVKEFGPSIRAGGDGTDDLEVSFLQDYREFVGQLKAFYDSLDDEGRFRLLWVGLPVKEISEIVSRASLGKNIARGTIMGETHKNPFGMIHVVQAMKFHFTQLYDDDLEPARGRLRHPFFLDHENLIHAWNNASVPHRAFKAADELVLVDRDRGYIPISRDELDDFFVFDRISESRPNFKIRSM